MEPDEKIQSAISNTFVLRFPRQQLATFGITNIYYYMVTELMPEVNVVREGRVIAARPKIITPAYLMHTEGFSGPARRYIQMAADQNPHEPGILYSYKNEFGEMSVVAEPLGSIVDNINRRIDKQCDPLSTIIKGVEEMWDVSLMKFTFDLTKNSAQRNFSELWGRGRFNVDRSGVPDDARERIEELMDMTARDPSFASELVSELQRWELWDSYQDRFLKLFRKL